MAPADECALRRSLVAQEFADRSLDALLISGGANLRYLTGFTGSNGMLLLTPGRALLFTDPRYGTQGRSETSCPVRVCKGPLLDDAVAAISRMGLRRVGFERARLSYDQYETLKSRLPMHVTAEPVAGLVERRRTVKSADEVALIRRSMQTACAAFEQAVRHTRGGMRESDLAAEIDYRMRRLGAERPAFETIVAAGARSALPHASPGAAKLQGLVLVDMGASQDGYASDMTRMLFLGSPPPKVKRLYAAVLEAQQAALDTVRAGVAAGAVDRAARRVLRRHALERAFIHSTGHGLGLEIHEAPRLGRKETTLLEAGMTVTVEPGAYLEGYGGVRIEDTVVVTATGCEILTRVGKELRPIG